MTTTLLADAVRQHGSPLWAYDAQTIHQRIDQLKQHFDTVRFAQKANPNLHVLRLIRERGLVLDAVSLGEMERAFAAGTSVGGEPAGVVLTCDVLDQPTLARVVETGIEVNAGSIDMLRQLGERSPATECGCASTPASAMATAARPIPAARTASTASGTNNCPRRWPA